jgi:hypothetical protein
VKANPIHPYSLAWLHQLGKLFPIVCVVTGIGLAIMLVSYGVIKSLLKFMHRRQLSRQEVVFLELTPPLSNNRLSEANEGFYDVLHGLGSSRSLRDNLLAHKLSLSLEYLTTREKGIRYIMRVPVDEVSIVEQEITSLLPDIRLVHVDDPFPETFDLRHTKLIRFQLSGPFAFPLNTTVTEGQHDPLSYITNALTRLKGGEFIGLQLVITPVVLREADTISRRAMNSEDLLHYLKGRKLIGWHKVAHVINSILFGILNLVGEVFNGSSSSHGSSTTERQVYERMQIAQGKKPAQYISPGKQKLVDSIHDKVSQPLFYVSFRAAIVTDNKKEAKARVQAINSSMAAFKTSHQRLKKKYYLPLNQLKQYHLNSFHSRKPRLRLKKSMILSSAELAALYHFPRRVATQTENLVVSLSRTLPAPLSLKQNTPFDLVLGRNHHNGSETAIGLYDTDRERHVYIIGGTGNGKTTMLLYGIVQDMQKGRGVAVIDPHGDMAETLLCHVPPERIQDVIYFNPDDLLYPIGLNLLELTPGLTGKALLREKDLITESVVSVFRKIFSEEDTGGHRIEYVLRNTIQTALTIPDATLFTIFDLLNDPKYRRSIVRNLDNKDLKNFWANELGKAGEMQRVKMAAGITAKIGRFLFSASAKQILEQPKSTIDFDDIINSGKILICNFSKGLLGEDTAELFGITVLAKLQLASLRRARITQAKRQPFYLYVDEFQNFATQSFVQMLSESRKYKLYLTMAEQSTSQQKDQQMVSVILANVGTIISFRTGNAQDERLLLPMFSPYLNTGDISNLATFNFYVKLAATKPQEPLSGMTLLLSEPPNEDICKKVVENSRRQYAKQVQDEVSDDVEQTTMPALPAEGLIDG